MNPNEHAKRKDRHLDLAGEMRAQSLKPTGFDRIRLTHQALPEIALADVDVSADLLGRRFDMPLMIGAMTGGTSRGDALNLALAEAAQAANVPLALGSQRTALSAEWAAAGSKRLRHHAADAFLLGNLGGAQLVKPSGLDMARRAVEMIEADALMVHLNPLQEAVQPDGNTDWRGLADCLATLIVQLDVPVFVKEVGAGLSVQTIRKLYEAGVRHVELAGLGGTNWTRIEQTRRDKDEDVFAPFLDWGITTLEALQAVTATRHTMPGLSVIASGGLHNGLDSAKALWSGADFTAAAGPFLTCALDLPHDKAVAALTERLRVWKQQLELACFLTGSQNLQTLPKAAGETLPL